MIDNIRNSLAIFAVIAMIIFMICIDVYLVYLFACSSIIACGYKYDYGSLKDYENICQKLGLEPYLKYDDIERHKGVCKYFISFNILEIYVQEYCDHYWYSHNQLLVLYPISYFKYCYRYLRNSKRNIICYNRVKGLWKDE